MWKYLLAVLLVVVVLPALGQDIKTAASPAPVAQPVYATVARSDPASSKSKKIVVNVRMLEFSETKLGKLSSERYGGSRDLTVLELLAKLKAASADGQSPNFAVSSDPKLLALIEALRKDHLVTVLAAPTMTVIPDKPASVLVGGELAFPTKDSQGKEVIAHKEYGTRLDVTAHLVSRERIRLETHLRVTEPYAAHSAQAGRDTIPAWKSREFETVLECRPGQTIALGGLAEERSSSVASPLGDAGDNANSSGARRLVVETFQCFVLVNAEIVTEGIPAANATKPAVQR